MHDYSNLLTLSNVGKLIRTRVVKLIPDIFVLYKNAPKNMKLILWDLSVLEFYGRRNSATHCIHVCDKENDFLQENSVNNTQHESFHYKRENLLKNRLALCLALARELQH